MKRSKGINTLISCVLGMALGSWISLAVSMPSIYYGVLAIFAIIALFLNICCSFDTKGKSDSNEDDKE